MNTSSAAFASSQGAIKDRTETVFEVLSKLGRATAFEIMGAWALIDGKPADGEEYNAFCQGVHSSCSQLVSDGRIVRLGTKVNPRTGKDVYEYAIADKVVKPAKNPAKSYKERYEALLEEMKELRTQKEVVVGQNARLREENETLRAQLKSPAFPNWPACPYPAGSMGHEEFLRNLQEIDNPKAD